MRKKTDDCEYCHAALGAVERRVTVYRHLGGKHLPYSSKSPRAYAPGAASATSQLESWAPWLYR